MINKEFFGKTKKGEDVYKYSFAKDNIAFSVLDFGATLYTLETPDKNGVMTDVVLMPKNLADIECNSPYMGATVGRYANRIKKSTFVLNGETFSLTPNNGNGNCLHGGVDGFDKRVWAVEEIENGICFSLVSPDGDQGFPGTLNVRTAYTIEDNGLNIEYTAVCDKDTIINMTNHSYFNVNGHTSGNLLKHTIALNSDFHVPVDDDLIPTGEILKNEGTIFDTKKGVLLTEKYDHCFILNDNNYMKYAGYLKGDISGITMSVYTTKPGIQIYCAKKLTKDFIGKHGEIYPEESFVCMETESFPDAPNNPHFPSVVYKKDEIYNHKTIYKFS